MNRNVLTKILYMTEKWEGFFIFCNPFDLLLTSLTTDLISIFQLRKGLYFSMKEKDISS